MHQGSTLILKGTILLIALVVLAVCVFVMPMAIRTDNTGLYRQILQGIYVTAIPFFLALYQAMKLLSYIDKNNAFSDMSVDALKYIKWCAMTIGAFYAAGMPYIYYVADKDDAPGVILVGFIILGASIVIATFAAVLQTLLKSAIEMKSGNHVKV